MISIILFYMQKIQTCSIVFIKFELGRRILQYITPRLRHIEWNENSRQSYNWKRNDKSVRNYILNATPNSNDWIYRQCVDCVESAIVNSFVNSHQEWTKDMFCHLTISLISLVKRKKQNRTINLVGILQRTDIQFRHFSWFHLFYLFFFCTALNLERTQKQLRDCQA